MSTLSKITLISQVQVSADTAAIDITSIPQTYTHLILMGSLASSSSVNSYVVMQFNNITTVTYTTVYNAWTSGAYTAGYISSATSRSNIALTAVPDSRWGTSYKGSFICHLLGYSQTGLYKSMVSVPFSGSNSSYLTTHGNIIGQTQSLTDGITSIKIFCDNGNITAGSNIYLYGIVV